MTAKLPNKTLESLLQVFPELEKNMSVEEIMTLMQAAKAIVDKDTNAYKTLMDSVYGAPKQEIEMPGIIKIKFTDEGDDD